MAKKKKSKENKPSFGYSIELTGLVLILMGIIGFGFGPVGTLFKKFSMFIAGTYWYIVVISLIVVGIYMLFKRKMPNFFTTKLIGLYILIIVLLSFNHLEFLKEENVSKIFTATYDNYIKRMNTISSLDALTSSGTSSLIIGGGIVGAVFISLFYMIAGTLGSQIIMIVLILFGLILLFDLNIASIFGNFGNKVKTSFNEGLESNKKTVKKEVKFDDNGDLEFSEAPISLNEISSPVEKIVNKAEEEDKIIITSIDEIKNKPITPSSAETTVDEAPVNLEHTLLNIGNITPPEKEQGDYKLPSLKILNPMPLEKQNVDTEKIKHNKNVLERVMKDFGIQGKVVDMHVGPAVTQFEVTVPHGTKVNKISSINKEIALALAAKDVRIEAPIPGKSTIGIEIPNGSISSVAFREVLEATADKDPENKILVTLGKDLMGRSILEDIAKMPHLLVAGSTGSGKSVCINSMISSILMRYKPSDVKLVMVDPKKVELTNYNGIPHLLCPVVSDPKKASLTLQKIVVEMEKRYELFSEKQCKNIASYNAWVKKENSEDPFNPTPKMPYIVVIIDELADLMLVAGKEVEDSIMRITQMARAAGIHLIVATQRPSTDVITGLIKNNIPSRIAFSVSSQIDSRTILDMGGAEKLLGRGDMLYIPMGENTPKRIQGCFIADEEIEKLIDHCCKQLTVKYDEEMSNPVVNTSSGSANSEGGDDPLYDEVVEFAIEAGKISASLIQRRFRLGYNRAARMIELLESRGIVGPQNGSKPREVLVKLESNE